MASLNRKFFFFAFLSSCLIGLSLGSYVFWQVYFGDTKHLEKTAILSKIREETIIYYLDEQTQIGSLFDTNHRKYTSVKEVPQHLLDAMVAAEDKNFYQHPGVDFFALAKALVAGAIKGRFNRGASTITQQTVKNIVNDWEASFTRKFREMIKALQLERLYSKDQILEFYINQFYVVRNGNGIGIAAEYYFSKKPSELSLIESAFIAGSLKGPGKYNPFIKYTKEAKEKARFYAKQRKNYVIRRMFEQGLINKHTYLKTKGLEIPFNKGNFANSEVALMSLIQKELEKKEILDSIGLVSKEDLNVAGYKIYSTIDKDLQSYYQLAMRRNLSRVESILSDFSPEDEKEFKKLKSLLPGSFVYGKVDKIEAGEPYPEIHLNFGYPKGILDTNSLVSQAKLYSLGKRENYKNKIKEILSELKVGDVLFCEVLSYDKKKNIASIDLKRKPEVSGGLISLDKGEVRAIVAGFDTLGYNRALYAKRQSGSLFKSLVFYAGLQLGWSVLDPLDNIRKIFSYQGELYHPRPDHKSPYDTTSLLWTGVMSENLASIELGYKLTEKLNFENFQSLMKFLDFSPQKKEREKDFHARLSQETGVSLDRDGIREFQLIRSTKEIIPDLIFSKKTNLINTLKTLWWGTGYEEAVSKLLIRKKGESDDSKKDSS